MEDKEKAENQSSALVCNISTDRKAVQWAFVYQLGFRVWISSCI